MLWSGVVHGRGPVSANVGVDCFVGRGVLRSRPTAGRRCDQERNRSLAVLTVPSGCFETGAANYCMFLNAIRRRIVP